LERHQSLHVLLNNAGVLTRKRALTEDGIETQLAVNLLAPFLLTHLMLDVLKDSAPARVVNITSRMHRFGKIDFGNLQGEKKYSVWGAYNQAKLGLILFTYELARRLEGTGVAVNCLHPGVVATGIMRDFHRIARLLWDMSVLSPEKGAVTSIYLTSSPEVEGISGKYFENKKQKKSSPASYDLSLAGSLWDACAKMTGVV
jgi:NAD(P)-dependent dehydrogenase (short-subunit alcohol dehydrogenase family)